MDSAIDSVPINIRWDTYHVQNIMQRTFEKQIGYWDSLSRFLHSSERAKMQTQIKMQNVASAIIKYT